MVIQPRAGEVVRFRFTTGTLEALKWLALACMVVDHVNAVFFHRELGLWATILGRISMPVFALVFGYNLARPGVDRLKVTGRLMLVGALATLVYAPLLGAWPLNVLFTFAVAALLVEALERGNGYIALALVISTMAVDYFLPGVVLVTVGCGIARHGLTQRRAVILAAAMAGLCVLVGNAWALLALPILWAASRVDLAVPRLRWAFLAAYPVHLVVLLLLRGWRGA